MTILARSRRWSRGVIRHATSATAAVGVVFALLALRTGRVRTEGIVTHTFGLGDFGQALTATRLPGAVKAVIDPQR